MANQDDMLAQANGLNANLAKIASVLQTRFALAAYTGTFALAAAPTTTVTDANVKASSIIWPVPTNAAAATLMGSAKSLYVSARNAGTSFVVATADGTAAAGGQTFAYVILNVG